MWELGLSNRKYRELTVSYTNYNKAITAKTFSHSIKFLWWVGQLPSHFIVNCSFIFAEISFGHLYSLIKSLSYRKKWGGGGDEIWVK